MARRSKLHPGWIWTGLILVILGVSYFYLVWWSDPLGRLELKTSWDPTALSGGYGSVRAPTTATPEEVLREYLGDRAHVRVYEVRKLMIGSTAAWVEIRGRQKVIVLRPEPPDKWLLQLRDP